MMRLPFDGHGDKDENHGVAENGYPPVFKIW